MKIGNKSPQILRALSTEKEKEKFVFQDKFNEKKPNDKEFADFSEIVNFLLATAGMTIEKLGQDDDRVRQSVEANLGKLLIRYISDVHFQEILKCEDIDTIRYWNGEKWKRGTKETLEQIIAILLEKCDVGIVYQFYSPKKIATEVMKALSNNQEKKYKPTTDVIGFKNGILDLKTMTLLNQDKTLTPRFSLGFEYNPEAQCPKFEKCVHQALDKITAKVLQEAVGNLFLDNRHEKIVVLCGNGRDGKSTILEAVTEALGKKDVTNYNLNAITQASGQAIANMRGKLANICFDSGNIKIGNEDLLKCYASGEPMPSKVLYKQPTMTTDYPKTILALNNLPTTSDYSLGYFRRLLIIPFVNRIPQEQININLKNELKEERQGILNWILIGLKRLKEQGCFSYSPTIEAALNRYRTDADSVACFIEEENFEVSEQPELSLAEVYSCFSEWQRKSGFQNMTNRKFAQRLRLLNIKVDKKGGSQMCWLQRKKTEEDLPF